MVSGEELRQMALALPESEEIETWGHPTFRVRNKIFASMGNEGLVGGVKATLHEQEMLVTTYPDTFSVAEYVGRFGWVSVQLTRVDAELLRDLVVAAWRRTAPKRLVKAFDEGK